MGTILAWTAAIAAAGALLGLWRSTSGKVRLVWRTLAAVSAMISAAVMAMMTFAGETRLASFLAASGATTAPLYGIGLWLGLLAILYEEYRQTHSSAAASLHSGLWSDITRELTSNDSLDTMLLNVAGAFRREVDGDCAHVYKISAKNQRAYRTGTVFSSRATVAFGDTDHGELLGELAWWASHEHESAIVDDAADAPVATFPLRDDAQTYAVILVQNPKRVAPTHWRQAAALVARTISHWCDLSRYRDRGAVAERLTMVMPELNGSSGLETALKTIDYSLTGTVDYDYLSISTLGSSRAHEDRATMLSGSRRVIESRHRWPVTGATLHRVLSTGRAVITPDLDMSAEDEDVDPMPWERRLGMRSRLIVPILEGEKVIGSITLAHRQYARFSENEAGLMATVAAFLAPWIRQNEIARHADRNDRVQKYLRQIDEPAHASLDDDSLVREAGGMVDATGLRVYRIGESKDSLTEVITAGRLAGDDSPHHVLLQQLPWHRWALESRRTLSVDQGDPESIMSKEEATLAMTRSMKTGCLVPIIANGQPLGVIDVIEQRHPDRSALDGGSKQIVEKLADILAKRWLEPQDAPAPNIESNEMCERLKVWSRQIVNPLTSIIGSVELIRHKEVRLGSETIKYLGTIERSATRIHESLLSIIEEAANGTGNASGLMPRERWSWTRSSETAPVATVGFARPASLAEAAMPRSGLMPTTTSGLTTVSD